MTNPLDDTSRWTWMGPRFERPQIIIDEMRKLMRDAYGDELADFVESTIPSPYGTLVIS